MEKYRPYMEFTAQGQAYQALMLMISQLEQRPHAKAELLPVVVFMAFTVEAYVNSLGARHIDFWDQIERISWRNKVEILHVHAGQRADWGGKQLQYAAELFSLRDRLAHGKPEFVRGPICVSQMEAEEKLSGDMLDPPWFRKISGPWLAGARGSFRDLMRHLSGLYSLDPADHQLHSTGGFEVIRE